MRITSVTCSVNLQNWEINKSHASNTVTFGAKPQQSINIYKRLLNKFTGLFLYNSDDLPSTVHFVRRASDNSLLGFNVRLSNDNVLAVNKCYPDKNKMRVPYLVLKENGNGAFKDCITIDLTYGRLIYSDRNNVTPLFEHGRFKEISLYDEKHAIYENQLETWFKEIFPEDAAILQAKKDAKFTAKPVVTPKTNIVPAKKQPIEVKKEEPITNTVNLPEPNGAIIGNTEKLESANVLFGDKKADEAVAEVIAPKERYNARGLKTGYGILDKSVQDDIVAINVTLAKLTKFTKDFIYEYKMPQSTITNFKLNYEPLAFKPKRDTQGVVFKYGKDEALKVVNTLRLPQFTRIVHITADGKETHYLIHDKEKVIANLCASKQINVPRKPRYYSAEELKELPVTEYVKFLRNGLEKYYSDMVTALKDSTPRTHKPKNMPDTVIKKPVEKQEAPVAQIDKITEELSQSQITNTAILAVQKAARDDAKKLAQTYTDTFIDQFKKSVSEQMENLRKLISEMFS